jgi:hypothetical protein
MYVICRLIRPSTGLQRTETNALHKGHICARLHKRCGHLDEVHSTFAPVTLRGAVQEGA